MDVSTGSRLSELSQIPIQQLDEHQAMELLEEMERQARLLADEKERALASLATDIEQQLRLRMTQRAEKEAQWVVARELYMGKLSTLSYKRLVGDYAVSGSNSSGDQEHRDKLRLNIIRPHVRTALSQLISMQFGAGEKNWGLVPSRLPAYANPAPIGPDPMYDMAMGQEAPPQPVSDTAPVKRMEDTIDDQLEAGAYMRETKKAMLDMAVLGTGVMKGPVNAGRMKKTWRVDMAPDGSVIRVPTLLPEYVPCAKWVDLWLFYPDMTVRNIEDAEDAIEIHPMSKRDLQKLQAHKGYMPDKLAELLEEGRKDFVVQSHLPQYSFLNSDLFKDKWLVWERHGRVERDCLCKLGIDLPDSEDTPKESYWAEVWGCNGKIIRVELSNLETTCSVPYAVDVWEEDPSSIFGFGIPLMNEDQQRAAEGMWDVMVDNAKVSSGPIVVIDRSQIEPAKDGRYDVQPWQVYLTKGIDVDVNKAVQFAEIPNMQEPLMNILNMAKGFASEEASIPMLAGGMESAQVGTGATGAALAAKASTSVLFEKASQWSDNITSKIIGWMYDWNMQYNKDESIKGDFEVDVRTATSYLRQHIEVINLDKLITQASQNPELQRVLKIDEAARALITNMQLPASRLVRTQEEIAEYDQHMAQNQSPDPATLKHQAEMGRLEVQREKLELERQQLAWERQHGQQRAMMEYEAKQEANDARAMEAIARVKAEQLKHDWALTQLAAKQGVDYAKLMSDLKVQERNANIREFVEAAKMEIDVNKQALHKEEMQLRRDTGQGI